MFGGEIWIFVPYTVWLLGGILAAQRACSPRRSSSSGDPADEVRVR
jgi:hypothetical protein